jgi:4-amino-4-deoxy-L-arabinose transferase-like glycosyltransferase
VAVLAAGLFTLVPTVLAHAGLATTDMPLTACLSGAFFASCFEPKAHLEA